jgi:hypothetical protein
MMDPQLKSILTSIGMTLATAIAGAAAAHGYITAANQTPVAESIVTVIMTGITALLGWYKAQSNTQTALIKAVNDGDNGVKVVAASLAVPQVTVPIKEVGK